MVVPIVINTGYG